MHFVLDASTVLLFVTSAVLNFLSWSVAYKFGIQIVHKRKFEDFFFNEQFNILADKFVFFSNKFALPFRTDSKLCFII